MVLLIMKKGITKDSRDDAHHRGEKVSPSRLSF